MWKVGLIGTGFWSEKHLQAWKRIPGVEIAALCNRSEAKLRQRAEQFGVPADRLYTSAEAMLEQADIDIVDIVTGPETHEAFVGMAARAGKAIMCQKPFASSLEEAARIVADAEARGVRLMVTENWRWLQPFQVIKRLLDEAAVGKIRMVRYAHSDYFTARMTPERLLPQPFLTQMPKLMFFEMGVHWFDTWRFLFGDPLRLYAEMRRNSPHVAGEDAGIVTLAYDGFYGTMDMSWTTRRELTGPLDRHVVHAYHKEAMAIDGERGTILLDTEGTVLLVDDEGGRTIVAEHTELDHEESHFRLQSHFIDCLRTGRPFQTSGADNLRTLRLVFAAYRSAEEHVAIALDTDSVQESGMIV